MAISPEGRRLYVETRLYNVHDRLASAYLSDKIDDFIEGSKIGGLLPNYLPYRESNMGLDPYSSEYGKNIFRLDDENMRLNCCGVIGNFDGIGYDSGCAFEVGLAHALGYPVNLISTEYMNWSVGNSGRAEGEPAKAENYYHISRLMEHVAHIIKAPPLSVDQRAAETYELPLDKLTEAEYNALTPTEKAETDAKRNAVVAARKKKKDKEKAKEYFEAQSKWRDANIDLLKVAIKEAFSTATCGSEPLKALPVKYDYYIDPNFQYSEAGRMLLEKIEELLKDKKVYIGKIKDTKDMAEEINEFCSCKDSILFGEPFEANVDTAILEGIAWGIDRPSILYCSLNQEYFDGYITSKKNLMCTYGAGKIATSLKSLEDIIQGKA